MGEERSKSVSDWEFQYNPKGWTVTSAMKKSYEENGFVIIRNVLNAEEVAKVRSAVEDSKGHLKHAFGKSDGERFCGQCLWNHPGDDVNGVLVRSHRVASTMKELMGGDEIYHYHSKLIMKAAKTGGSFVWHQDYGYWYFNGCLYPDMGSVFIPIDDCVKANGCLQVLVGSHKMGRQDHVQVGTQLGADPERVEEAKKLLKHVYVEMKAGDILYFHCNLLHTSAPNNSDMRRWAFIVAFNKRSNDPYKDKQHARYTPLKKVDDSELLKCNVVETLEGKWFMNPTNDTIANRSRQKIH